MSRPDCGWRVRRLSLRYPCRDAHGSVFDPLSAGHPSLLRWAVPSCPRCLLPPSPENPACPLWQVGFLRWCELRSRLLRPRDLQAGTPRKPLRTKSVTHVSSINRNPCVRYGPRSTLVPGEGFEPPTNGLQNRCSTPELTRLPLGYLPARVQASTSASYRVSAGGTKAARITKKQPTSRARTCDRPAETSVS